jgi:hypothetical protein
MVDFVGKTERVERCGRIATTHDGEAACFGHRFGYNSGAGGESRIFEHAHWSVPEDRACLGDDLGEFGCRARAYVETFPSVGDVATKLTDIASSFGIADLAARSECSDIVRDVDHDIGVEQSLAGFNLIGLEK